MDPVERLLRERYCPETLKTEEAAPAASIVSKTVEAPKAAPVVKAVDTPKIQLVMSVDDFTEDEIFKACGEFNKANPKYMDSSYQLLTDITLPTGHILKAKSWILRLDNL
ncbi:hypothetical protein ACFPU0_13225 [Pseudomonas sp. GCM10022186]|uniref:hypothetical protein n=1 Tax=Pseudomonas sp. GCM10022186 TaxID=3252650 RepID=UPI00360A8E45